MENSDKKLLGNWDLYDQMTEEQYHSMLRDSGQEWKSDAPWPDYGQGPWAASDLWR